jgi:hypothetical protein
VWLAVSIEESITFILEGLMRIVQKSKKPVNDWSAGASNEHQEEGKKCTYGEMLSRVL